MDPGSGWSGNATMVVVLNPALIYRIVRANLPVTVGERDMQFPPSPYVIGLNKRLTAVPVSCSPTCGVLHVTQVYVMSLFCLESLRNIDKACVAEYGTPPQTE